jgi:uncharacterized pyridoxamine 5'-phosphate oxidase family protein
MGQNDCVKFANANPASYLATQDGNQPRVRGLLLWYADASGLYYNIGATKDVYKQLQSKSPSLMPKAKTSPKCA